MALDTTITSLYEYQVHERRNDIADLNNQICADWNYIHEFENSKASTESFGYQFKREIGAAAKELEKTRDEMYAELEEFATGMFTLSNWYGKGLSEEELFTMLFEPLQTALQPLLDILPNLGLPNIPIIGNLLQLIQRVSDMGRMIRKLPQEVVDAARAEAESAKAVIAEKEAIEKQKRQAGMSWDQRAWDDFKNSKFGKICKEIVDILKDVLDIIKLIAQNATLFAILELIKLLKPVLDAFQIGVGTIVTLLTNIATLVRALIFSSAQMLRYLYKVLEKKLTQLWDVLYYVCSGGWSLPVNALISGAYSDIVCCNIEISGLIYEINDLDLTHSIELTDEQLSAYQDKAKQLMTEANAKDTVPFVKLADISQAMFINNVKIPVLLSTRNDLVDKSAENTKDYGTLKSTASTTYKLELEKLVNQDTYLEQKQREFEELTSAPIIEGELANVEAIEATEREAAAANGETNADSSDEPYSPSDEAP